jgi:hypothetical protein
VLQDINLMVQNVFIIQQDLLFINVLVDMLGMVFHVFLEELKKIVRLEHIGMETNVTILILNLGFYQDHL